MDPVGKRRLAWALFALFNVTSGAWLNTIPHWKAFWLLGLAASLATTPMLMRSPSARGWPYWLPVALATTLALVVIARLLAV